MEERERERVEARRKTMKKERQSASVLQSKRRAQDFHTSFARSVDIYLNAPLQRQKKSRQGYKGGRMRRAVTASLVETRRAGSIKVQQDHSLSAACGLRYLLQWTILGWSSIKLQSTCVEKHGGGGGGCSRTTGSEGRGWLFSFPDLSRLPILTLRSTPARTPCRDL